MLFRSEGNFKYFIKDYELIKGNKSEENWMNSLAFSEQNYNSLIEDGWKPEQARSILPNSLKTEIVVSCDLQEWKHIFKLRTSPAAHPQMSELMIPLYEDFKKLYPEVFE